MTGRHERERGGTSDAGARVPVLRVSDLSVRFRTGEGEVRAAEGLEFEVHPGEVVTLVGESGSGKSVTAMSLLGLLDRGASVTGSATLAGTELVGMDERGLRGVRGRDIAMIFQEPMTSLNPVFTIGWQMTEVLRAHMGMGSAEARRRAAELLEMVGIADAERRLGAYPHQMSGGQRQRVMIAMAMACEPAVLLADEPTTALDVTVQAGILDLLRRLRDRSRTAIVLITHDMGVVADIADRVVVMYRGDIVEQGPVHQVFAEPRHEYTRALLAAVPHLGRPGRRPADAVAEPVPPADSGGVAHDEPPPPALDVCDLVVDYGRVRAVDGVSLRVGYGEIVGLVGESGSGKSTVGRCAVGLHRPSSGTVAVSGDDIARVSPRRLRALRRHFTIVFQDPASSLDPRMTVGASIAEPLRAHHVGDRRERDDRVVALMEQVALHPGLRRRYPHELSGGQRQRVSIARALALEPRLVVADEPTSALDVSVQAEVLEIFADLQRRLGFAALFISHDLAVVEMLAARIAVMRAGRIVETGDTGAVLAEPDHEYTRALLAAAPVPDPATQRARHR